MKSRLKIILQAAFLNGFKRMLQKNLSVVVG